MRKNPFRDGILSLGATKFKEPGVFMSFEETERDLTENVSSLGFDLKRLEKEKKLSIEHVRVERSEIQETGEYDLEALFIRLGHAIDSIGAKRVVLDTIEVLFGGFENDSVLRSEIKRLFSWLKERGVTAVITGERGDGTLTRHGLEEYISDCVILLDHRVIDQTSTRRLRVVKYRGSVHGTSEYPFIIDEEGISVLPLSSIGLDYDVSKKRISSGVPALDEMLGGKGFFRGSTVLISGAPGTGKSSLSARVVEHAAEKGERCIYFSLEESPKQILRNMASINIHLEKYVANGKLKLIAQRPSVYGLERHLVELQKLVTQFKPSVVVLDPLTSFASQGNKLEVVSILSRMIDMLKGKGVTGVFTSLTTERQMGESSEVDVSSLIDTWLIVRELESDEERTRGIYVLKSRGMPHSKQIRKFDLTSKGILIQDFKKMPVLKRAGV